MDLAWYLLSVKCQRNVRFIIERLQRGVGFTIGPFDVYSYEVLRIVSLNEDN